MKDTSTVSYPITLRNPRLIFVQLTRAKCPDYPETLSFLHSGMVNTVT